MLCTAFMHSRCLRTAAARNSMAHILTLTFTAFGCAWCKCMQALCLSQLSSRQPIPQDALLLHHKASSSSGGKRSSSVAAAAARHPAATAAAAVEERIEEKELHIEASEAYLAVSDYLLYSRNQTALSIEIAGRLPSNSLVFCTWRCRAVACIAPPASQHQPMRPDCAALGHCQHCIRPQLEIPRG
jgi:hypothetical protein